MKALKDYTTICSSAPSELLALMALRSPEPILAANRARVERNARTAADFFARHTDTLQLGAAPGGHGVLPAAAGCGCGTRREPRQPRTAAGGPRPSAPAVLEETGVLLLPSTVYGYGDAHFRLGLGRDDFREGLDVLDGFLRRAAASSRPPAESARPARVQDARLETSGAVRRVPGLSAPPR